MMYRRPFIVFGNLFRKISSEYFPANHNFYYIDIFKIITMKYPIEKKGKILLFSILLLLTASSVCAKNRIITHPLYEFTTSGVTNITKIETDKNKIRVHIHSTFLPNWWVKFSKKDFLQDCETGEKYYAIDIENGEFDKEIFMPASGDSTFVLIFPKPGKEVRKLNFGHEDITITFGISLDPKEKPKDTEHIPQYVIEWINEEVGKSKPKEADRLTDKDFFSSEPARIVGFIKGFDERSGLSAGIIYAKNVIIIEDHPTVLTIHPDGRFEATLSMHYPSESYIELERTLIPFYIEPGQTLAMVLDWRDFLEADRFRDREHKFERTKYSGPAALINQELLQIRLKAKDLPQREMYKKISELSPAEYKTYITPIMEKFSTDIEELFEEENISTYTQTLVRNKLKIIYAQFLFDMDNENRYRAYQGKIPYEMPQDYFDFLQDIPLNDPSILATVNYDVFINRLELCTPLSGATSAVYDRMKPKKTFSSYLFDELGIDKSEEDNQAIRAEKSLSSSILNEPDKDTALVRSFYERYDSYMDAYETKYVNSIKQLTKDEVKIAEWALKDSIYTHVLKLPSSLSYDICKVRSLNFTFKELLSEQEEYRTLEWIKKNITNEFLISEAEKLYATSYQNKKGYELPANDRGAEVFKSIIDPFKGKYVFVDFWGTFCAPCIHSIKLMKETRKTYVDSEDAVFLFITSDYESPLDSYNKFVNEQELTNTYRISSNDYLYLRQLFKFNGIPRYVLVSREGHILNEKFAMHNFENELKRLLAEEQNR